MFDGMSEGAQFAEIVRGYVERATAPLLKRIADLEGRGPLDIDSVVASLAERGFAQAEGVVTRADVEEIERRLDAAIRSSAQEAATAAVAALPVPRDGKDADPDAIDLMIAQAVARLPTPADGKSVTLDDVAPLIAEAVEKAVAALPVPKDGVGLAGAVIDRSGSLVVTLTDGSTRELGPVVGKDGDKGKPGFSLTDFNAELSEDGRTLVLSFESDDVRVTHQLEIGAMAYRGAYSEGEEYRKGDMTFFAGSLWHCDAPTAGKPGIDPAWSLATKRGRDGKPAVGISDARIDERGHLILTLSDTTTKDCGMVRGRDGKDMAR